MNLSLPFYGKKGTIKNIVEHEKGYTVSRYELNGQDSIVSNVPKKNENYKLLIENYCDDLKEYLEANASKYEGYNLSKTQKPINPHIVNIMMFLTVLMVGTSIPLLLDFQKLGILGIILDVLAIPTLITTVNLSMKESNDKMKEKFIKNYQELQERYKFYINNKSKQNYKTQYKGLEKNKESNEIVRNLNIIRELKKVANQ